MIKFNDEVLNDQLETMSVCCRSIPIKPASAAAMCHVLSLFLLTFLVSPQFLSQLSSSPSSVCCASAAPSLYSSSHSSSASSPSDGDDEDSPKLTGLFFGKRNLNPNINHLLFGRRSATSQKDMEAAALMTLMKGDQQRDEGGIDDTRFSSRGRWRAMRWPFLQLTPIQSISR